MIIRKSLYHQYLSLHYYFVKYIVWHKTMYCVRKIVRVRICNRLIHVHQTQSTKAARLISPAGDLPPFHADGMFSPLLLDLGGLKSILGFLT